MSNKSEGKSVLVQRILGSRMEEIVEDREAVTEEVEDSRDRRRKGCNECVFIYRTYHTSCLMAVYNSIE